MFLERVVVLMSLTVVLSACASTTPMTDRIAVGMNVSDVEKSLGSPAAVNGDCRVYSGDLLKVSTITPYTTTRHLEVIYQDGLVRSYGRVNLVKNGCK